jgi:16S rRNA (uracil1498-N3)-methyltransferase
MEWMLEKLCELGAGEWMPVLTERSVVSLSRERWESKLVRWKKIAIESCKQCGQASVPRLSAPVPFKEAMARLRDFDLVLIPTLEGAPRELHSVLQEKRPAKSVLVLIGPEGDFSPKEIKMTVEKGAIPVGLGPRVLRAETAAVFALSVIRFFYGSQGAARGREL